jgi:hypothetical protein
MNFIKPLDKFQFTVSPGNILKNPIMQKIDKSRKWDFLQFDSPAMSLKSKCYTKGKKLQDEKTLHLQVNGTGEYHLQ